MPSPLRPFVSSALLAVLALLPLACLGPTGLSSAAPTAASTWPRELLTPRASARPQEDSAFTPPKPATPVPADQPAQPVAQPHDEREPTAAPQATGERQVNIPLWPLLEWTTEADGSEHMMALFLYESERAPDGELVSIRVLNYLQGDGYRVFFPFYYAVGEGDDVDSGLVPLGFWGSGYSVWPLGLSYWWQHDDGSETTWVTPLYHARHDSDGKLVSRHLLLYVEGEEGWITFPLAYGLGAEGSRHYGFIPLYFQGPGYKIAPLLLSASWVPDGGGTTTWITPLYHKTTPPSGESSFHLLTYFQGPGYKVLFPLAWSVDLGDGSSNGVLPFFVWGDESWFVPLVLSGQWANGRGGRTTLVTPFFHHSDNPGGPDSFHVLNYFQGEDYKVFFPLAYSFGPDDAQYRGLVPLWFDTPTAWYAPLLLSAGWQNDVGGNTTWITPLFHHQSRAEGDDSFHLLTYFQGEDYNVFFPFWFRYSGEEDPSQGIFSLDYDNPEFWAIPPLLTGRWSDGEGEVTTWVTPFYHRTEREDGEPSFHLLNYFQGEDYSLFFPFAYSFGEEGDKSRGLIPLYFDGPDWWFVPLVLSGGWTRNDGGSSTWVTPFFHVDRQADGETSWHALNYFHGPQHNVFFPFYYSFGEPGHKHRGLVPLYFDGPDYWFAPLVLSARWGSGDSTSTWVTPLFHYTSREHGEDSWHALNYFRGPGYSIFFPLGYRFGEGEEASRGFLPLYMEGPDYALVPPLLSAWFRHGEDSESLWVTPFYHQTHNAHGQLTSRHLLNYFETPDLTTVFPVYWNYGTDEGHERAILAPLYWQTEYADGDYVASVLPPLFAYRDSPTGLNTSLLYQTIPFSYQRAGDDSELNILWRLFHRRDQHDLRTTVVGPLWYSEERDDHPMDYKLLGGLLARDVYETRGTYRDRYLWFFAGSEKPIDGWEAPQASASTGSSARRPLAGLPTFQ